MQTNVHIDTKNLKPSPEHRLKGSGYSKRTIEVSLFLFFLVNGVVGLKQMGRV